MFSKGDISLSDVKAIYNGPVGELWELLMGEQIHIGGFESSMDLATRAGIAAGSHGVDLCCCTGAGMRFLVQFRGVDSMTGVDATERMIELGRQRCAAADSNGKFKLLLEDVTKTSLADACADFVWGEDAWCYVEDKPALIGQAARLVKPGGVVAFTDWVIGSPAPSQEEATRFLDFMKFPSLLTVDDYAELLAKKGLEVSVAENTGRFAPCIDLYMDMVSKQHAYDALRILNFDNDAMSALGQEFGFVQQLARRGNIVQGIFVARKN